jgi:hypothetical protein
MWLQSSLEVLYFVNKGAHVFPVEKLVRPQFRLVIDRNYRYNELRKEAQNSLSIIQTVSEL